VLPVLQASAYLADGLASAWLWIGHDRRMPLGRLWTTADRRLSSSYGELPDHVFESSLSFDFHGCDSPNEVISNRWLWLRLET